MPTICVYFKKKVMKVEFEQEDVKTILYDSFCNGGLTELRYASVSIDWNTKKNKANYLSAKKRLEKNKKDSICYEDVMIEILMAGNSITFTDYEEEEDFTLTLLSVMNIFNSLGKEDKANLMTILTDECSCDAYNYSDAMQLALFGEVVYC